MSSVSEQMNIEKLLIEAANYHATDIHLSIANPPYLRVEGKLTPLENYGLVTAEFLEQVTTFLLTAEQRATLEQERELVVSYTHGTMRFRVHVFYQSGVLALSLKLITQQFPTLDKLGLPESVVAFAQAHNGLVVIAGPVDSGKSTTFAALLQAINATRAEHIMTIENPIERVFADDQSIVEQRELGRDVRSYAQALDSLLHEDVTVVAVPDMEEAGVASRLLDIAESNRLVLTTVTSDSATEAISKIINLFPEASQMHIRRQLADALVGVVVQLLIPQVGGGQVVAVELLLPTPAVRTVIREGDIGQLDTIIQTSRREGMVALSYSLKQLADQGMIAPENVAHYEHGSHTSSSRDV